MSDFLGAIRRLDDTGRVLIPKEVRVFMGLKPKDVVEIRINKKTSEIIIKKAEDFFYYE